MIDTHAHLLYFNKKADDIVSNMAADGLEFIVNIGTTVENSKEGIELAEKNDKIFATVGIYPEYASETSDEDLRAIENLTKKRKVVAVGEIGLDYHSENFDSKKQKEIFLKQLEIANKFNLPFCIHCRGEGAADDVYEILTNNKHLIKNSGLMHCYSEGSAWFKKFLDLGLYLSFSGNITYKKSDRSFLKDIPLDRLLVETDSPYLSPEPLRGRVNEPKNVGLVIKKIADEIGIDELELERITSENAKKFYRIG